MVEYRRSETIINLESLVEDSDGLADERDNISPLSLSDPFLTKLPYILSPLSYPCGGCNGPTTPRDALRYGISLSPQHPPSGK